MLIFLHISAKYCNARLAQLTFVPFIFHLISSIDDKKIFRGIENGRSLFLVEEEKCKKGFLANFRKLFSVDQPELAIFSVSVFR